VARVAASGSQQLVVEPFDRTILKDIEKAISMSGLNLTPNSDGNVIRINIPPLTEERRKELAKQVNFFIILFNFMIMSFFSQGQIHLGGRKGGRAECATRCS
jgi:hypothetical protein